MKKTLIVLFIPLLMGFYAFSQVPNSSFENWSGSEAKSWVSTNGLVLLGNPQSMFKTTNAHSGSSACEINTVHILYKPQFGEDIPDYSGFLILGKLVGYTPIFGMPYTYRPSTLRYWYKYAPVANDTAVAWVTLTRWNNTTQKRDTIGFSYGSVYDSPTVYQKQEFNITYVDSQTPDTLVILFASSVRSTNYEGSKYTIDDVELLGGNTGIPISEASNIEVYPNPTNDVLNIYGEELNGNVQVTISDIQGNTIYISSPKNMTNLSIPTANFSAGIYILKTISEKGTTTHKIILQ